MSELVSSNINRNLNFCATELYYLMQKIKEYEPSLYEDIKSRVGIPLMKTGNLFKFADLHSTNIYKVVKVCKVYATKKSEKDKCLPCIYQYGYCMRNYLGFQMLNWIYDSFIKNNYIKIMDIVEDKDDIEIDNIDKSKQIENVVINKEDKYWEKYLKKSNINSNYVL